MLSRRALLRAAGGGLALHLTGAACRPAPGDEGSAADAAAPGGDGAAPGDAAVTGDGACTATVTLYDTHAVALYFDDTIGPLTGVVTVDMVVAGEAVDFVFWHGHGGVDHRFVLEPAHCAALRRRERVMIQTTTVDGHAHLLFIDPQDPAYRVAGAEPRIVSSC